jgi:hypothetical protein
VKHKTATLEGALLDAAVAMAEGYASPAAVPLELRGEYWDEAMDTGGHFDWRPSDLWNQGGPIIERKRINLIVDGQGSRAGFDLTDRMVDASGTIELDLQDEQRGSTPLIAAMRAYVASKYGDEVELP